MKTKILIIIALTLTGLSGWGQKAQSNFKYKKKDFKPQVTQVINDTERRGIISAIIIWNNIFNKSSDGNYTFNVKAPISFTNFGVGWKSTNNINPNLFEIKYRTKNNKEAWTDWEKANGEISPDETPTNLYWSELIFVNDSNPHNQFEIVIIPLSNTIIDYVRIDIINMKSSIFIKGKDVNELDYKLKDKDCPQPPIIPRSDWCGSFTACHNPTYTPTAITPTHVIMHHGASPDTYTDGYAVVRSYWDYHVNSLGWLDIGYNYLVDKYGNIFLGRYNPSTTTQDVKGAHAGSSNSKSIGVCFLGNTDVTNSTTIQLSKLEDLLAWWFDWRGFDPTTYADIINQAGTSTLNLPRVCGHRDVNSTICPGDNLYNWLPTIRTETNIKISNCSGTPCTAPNAPTSCSTSIGTPANGLEHHTNLSCSAVTGADGYSYDYSWNGINWTVNWYQTTLTNFAVNNLDNPNASVYYRVRAYKCTPIQYSSYTYASPQPIYTACDNPAIPTVNNPTTNSLNITINTETPVANPAITTYSIYCTTTSQYVQANGTLGATEIFQTKSTWGTKTITGLSSNTQYCFYAKAKNNNGDIRYSASNYACGTTLTGCTTPGTPSANNPTGITQTGANFSWSAGSPSGSPTVTYYWAVGTSSTVTYESGYTARGTTTGATANTNALSCGTTYYFRLKAGTSCDNTYSGYSTYKQFTTSDCCTSPTANVPNDGCTLTCTASGGSGGNILYKWYNGTSCSATPISGATSSTYTAPTSGNYACKAYISGYESTCYDCDYGYADCTVDYITVTTPDGFTNWQAGTSHYIYWVDNISENVKIELYQGSSFNSTITISTSSNGSYYWSIPSSLSYYSNYRIKITSVSNSSIYDYSDYFNCGGTGIEDIDFINYLNIFPNPNTGEFIIEMNITKATDLEIKLLDVIGKVIYEEKLNKYVGAYQKSIYVGDISKGIYNLQLLGGEGIINKKIIIE